LNFEFIWNNAISIPNCFIPITGAGAGPEGIFNIYRGETSNYGLAVHENTHKLIYLNWGKSSSFMDEGLAMYTQALATNKDKNHRAVQKFIKENKLFPLGKMVSFQIGKGGPETMASYPASGSFVEFLIKTYGLKSFKQTYILENRPPEGKEKTSTWEKVYSKSLLELEKEWLAWLRKTLKF